MANYFVELIENGLFHDLSHDEQYRFLRLMVHELKRNKAIIGALLGVPAPARWKKYPLTYVTGQRQLERIKQLLEEEKTGEEAVMRELGAPMLFDVPVVEGAK